MCELLASFAFLPKVLVCHLLIAQLAQCGSIPSELVTPTYLVPLLQVTGCDFVHADNDVLFQISGCAGSSLFRAFTQHVLHRLSIPQDGPLVS